MARATSMVRRRRVCRTGSRSAAPGVRTTTSSVVGGVTCRSTWSGIDGSSVVIGSAPSGRRARAGVARPRPVACPTGRRASEANSGVLLSSGSRGRSNGTSTDSSSWPGRADMTATRSLRRTASSRLCVTKSTVRRSVCHRWSNSSCITARSCASSAANGSSMSRISGSTISARAIATRWRIPPESLSGYASARSCKPMRARYVRSEVVAGALGDARDVQPEPHVLEHRLPRVDRVVLEHHRGGRVVGATVDRDVTGRRAQQPGDDPQERRLAAPRRADDRDELALGDVEVEGPQSSHAGAGLPEPAFDGASRDLRPLQPVPLAHGPGVTPVSCRTNVQFGQG